jgi:hypothetical protein
MAARKKGATRKKSATRKKASKSRVRTVKLTLDLDKLERLYRRTHRGGADGDTKGSPRIPRGDPAPYSKRR